MGLGEELTLKQSPAKEICLFQTEELTLSTAEADSNFLCPPSMALILQRILGKNKTNKKKEQKFKQTVSQL